MRRAEDVVELALIKVAEKLDSWMCAPFLLEVGEIARAVGMIASGNEQRRVRNRREHRGQRFEPRFETFVAAPLATGQNAELVRWTQRGLRWIGRAKRAVRSA